MALTAVMLFHDLKLATTARLPLLHRSALCSQLLLRAGSTVPRPRSASRASISISASATTMAPIELQEPIKLTNEEQELFRTLVEAAEAAGERTGKHTVLRCAGGWVRDKLLGRDSDDIDIALDNMLGKEFAEEVNKYLVSKGKEARTAAVIQSNPDQSKHLETARMKVNNVWIDLVNLRSETYADGSRIPKMEFGSPEQDAIRRDFTINSLFYNLNENKVEDLTGKGKDDLRAGIIRTPLPPTETFLDDPLRVLRAVRFGTRFGFELEASIMEAAASEQVRQALASKVSRERVGTELEGMFNGPAPTEACRLLHRLCLFPEVFTPPPEVADQLGRQFGAACVETMGAAEAIVKARATKLDKDARRALLLAALLLPLRHTTHMVKNKPSPATSHIIRNSLKWRVKDIEAVATLHEVLPQLVSVHERLRQASSEAATSEQLSEAPDDVRIALGRAIRALKQHWQLGMMLVPVSTIAAARPLGVEAVAGEGGSAGGNSRDGSQEAGAGVGTSQQQQHQQHQQRQGQQVHGGSEEASVQQWVAMVEELMAAVHAFELQDCWRWKPLLDGKEAMKAVGMAKGGPQLGKLLAAVMDWQLAHPHGSAEECRAYMAANHKEPVAA